MNEPALRPAEITAAAVVVAGGLIIVWPQLALSFAGLVIATVAAAAGLHAFAVLAPPAWWRSPFEPRRRRRRRAGRADDLDWIRATLKGRRQPVENGPPLPPATLRLLQPLIRDVLEREGIDPDDTAELEPAGIRKCPLTRAVLDAEPLRHPPWFRTRRPDARHAAETVQGVLDELDRIVAGGHVPQPPNSVPGPGGK
jgi:hypothetical protein